MSIFEITIQNQRTPTEWPVLIKIELQDKSPIQINGTLQLSENDQEELSMLLYEPKNYGIFLGRALFRDKLYSAFREAFASTQKLMRVLLTIDTENSEQLKTLHWERLCVPIDNSWEHLALNQRLPFSQYLPSSNPDRSYPVISQSDLRALVMVANPENLDKYSLAPLDVATTFSGLKQALGNIPCDTLANDLTDAVGKPTLNQLCQQLSSTNPPYTILHIVCHGTVIAGENIVYWSDENNQVLPVKRKDLIERLRQLGNKEGLPHLTFLCSCSSGSPLGGIAQSLVRKLGMPAVVAMTDKVSIKTGLALAQNFYRQLRELGTVDIALQKAMAGLADRYDIVVPALFSSFRDRSLFAPAVKGKSAIKGSQVLPELMTNTQVRDVVIAFRTDFQASCEQIELLSSYKDWHDELHKLEFQCYRVIKFPVECLLKNVEDELALEELENYILVLQQIIKQMEQIVVQSCLMSSIDAQIKDLKKIETDLKTGAEQLDQKRLEKATHSMYRLLATPRSQVNDHIIATAQALRLPALVKAITNISDIQEQLSDCEFNSGKFSVLKDGTIELQHLEQDLTFEIKNHHHWQEIDIELRRIETNLKGDMEELKLSWLYIKKIIENQYDFLDKSTLKSFCKNAEHLEQAIEAQKDAEIKRYFRRIHREASIHFSKIDSKLKELCSKLRHLGKNLNSVLQIL